MNAICWVTCSDGRRVSAASSGSERFQSAAMWSRRRNMFGTQPAPSSITPTRKITVTLQHAVEHHRPDECLGSVVQADHVLAPEVLAAAQPVLGIGRPLFIQAANCIGVAPTCSTEGMPASASRAQNGSKSSWPGDRPPAVRWGSTRRRVRGRRGSRTRRWPCRRRRVRGADTDEPGSPAQNPPWRGCGARRGGRISGSRLGRRTCRGRTSEHQLALEAEEVERLAPLGAVERTEGLVALGPTDETIAEADELFDPGGRVRAASAQLLQRCLHFAAAGEVDAREPIAHIRVGVVPEKAG